MQKAIYILAMLFLALCYAWSLQQRGPRLPRYYTPDGMIISFGDMEVHGLNRFHEIDGVAPQNSKTFFKTEQPVLVATDQGVGIMKPEKIGPEQLVWDFKFLIVFSFVFLLCGIWFLQSANDIHLAVLSFCISLFFYLTVTTFSLHALQSLWQIALFSLSPAILNMSLRLTGKHISNYLLLAELIVTIFIALIANVGQKNIYTIYSLRYFSFYLLLFSILIATLIFFDSSIKRNQDPIEKWKRRAIFAGTFFGLLVPLAYLEFYAGWDMKKNIFLIPSLLAFFFPAGILYGTYRIYLIPFQLVLTRSLLATILTTFFIVIYGGVLLFHSIFLPEQDQTHQWIVNLVFVIILIFFLDPARHTISSFLEVRIFRLNPELTASLEKLASMLSSSIRGQSAMNQFLHEVQTVLRVEQIGVLFSEELFANASIRQGKIITLPAKSNLWRHLLPGRIVVTSYLTYGEGSRGTLYRFLLTHGIHLSIGVFGSVHRRKSVFRFEKLDRKDVRTNGTVSEPHAALLLGYRINGKKYRLAEIRYLQEAAHLGAMMMNDYLLLMQEVQKRRRIKELSFAGDIQRSISTFSDAVSNLQVSSISIPAISVSGDYLDVFQLPRNRVAGFLGDVSGHGLGTGYLVSAIRAMARSHLENGSSLVDTLNLINQFLMQRYRGNEFLTVVAFVLNTESGEFEYINAAHPGPCVRNPNTGELSQLTDTQRILGLLNSTYHSRTISFLPGERLFLYSDGVTETMNLRDEQIGEKVILNFFREMGAEPLDLILESLRTKLDSFRGQKTPADDTSCLAFEYMPTKEIRNRMFLSRKERQNREE